MIAFENYLIEKGYKKYAWDSKTNKFYEPKNHIISTMVNLAHFYIKDDIRIAIGLHEKDKPVTLIYPRPNILIKKEIGDEIIFLTEQEDDAVNIVLSKIDFETIYKAMFDKSTVIKLSI